MKKEKVVQQGDVLFFKKTANVSAMKKLNAENGRIIFAKGEATGHHHSVAEVSGVELYEDVNGTLWCSVPHAAEVEHQEHKPVTLKTGTYRIGLVREIDPFSEEINSVKD